MTVAALLVVPLHDPKLAAALEFRIPELAVTLQSCWSDART
jgi:hypothetical protein